MKIDDAKLLAAKVREGLPSHVPIEVTLLANVVNTDNGEIMTIAMTGRPPFLNVTFTVDGRETEYVTHPESPCREGD